MPTQHIPTLLHGRSMLRAFGHRVAICCNVLGVVGSSLKMVKLSQQHPTGRNRVAECAQHVAPNNVAICCVGMLRSFGRGLSYILKRPTILENYNAIRG